MNKRLGWQLVLATLGAVLLLGLLSRHSYTYVTKIVPGKGGAYVEGVAGFPQHINPVLSQYNDVDRDLCALVFRGLTKLDEHGNVLPDLARRWQVSPDGLTYTFYLDESATWQDGSPITSADVAFTIGLLQDQKYPGPPDIHSLWSQVKVTTPGPHTVRFKLKAPYAPFLDYTTQGIVSKKQWEHVPITEMFSSKLNMHPLGSGPWKIESITGSKATLVPNERYPWKKQPYLSKVQFRFYPDRESAFAAYRRRDVDGVGNIPLALMDEAEKLKDMNLYLPPIARETMIVFNLKDPTLPFFQDKDVRHALILGLDRQTLIKKVLHGYGRVIDSPILPENWAYSPAVHHYKYNPTEAEELLESAGWHYENGNKVREKNGKPLQFIIVTDKDPVHVKMIQMAASQWAKIGVKAIPRVVDFSKLVSDYLYPHNFSAALISWSLPGDPDPYPMWHSTQYERGQNFGGWSNRLADEAMEQARLTLNIKERVRLYASFQQAFIDDVPAILLYQPLYRYGIRNKVKGVSEGPLTVPSDRFRTISDWYIVSKRITTGLRIENISAKVK